jgi:hypothetical protein
VIVTRALDALLARARRDGAAYEPDVLAEPWRTALLDEVGAGTYAELPPVEGPYGVRQEGEYRVLTGTDVPPSVDAVRAAVVRALGVAGWWPDEVTVQRYAPGSTGVSTHRDGRRHAHLVAILTLEGSAVLRQCADREGTPLREWDADAGSLVLLRGPGLDGVEDGRPLHAVDGPITGRRTSLTLRSTSAAA